MYDENLEHVLEAQKLAKKLFHISRLVVSDLSKLSTTNLYELPKGYDYVINAYLEKLVDVGIGLHRKGAKLPPVYYWDNCTGFGKRYRTVKKDQILIETRLANLNYIQDIFLGFRKKLYLVLMSVDKDYEWLTKKLNKFIYTFKYFKILQKGKNKNFSFKDYNYLLIFECDFENKSIELY